MKLPATSGISAVMNIAIATRRAVVPSSLRPSRRSGLVSWVIRRILAPAGSVRGVASVVDSVAYSTVTVFARFLGWSTSFPFRLAT